MSKKQDISSKIIEDIDYDKLYQDSGIDAVCGSISDKCKKWLERQEYIKNTVS